jgi:hypothetical protein
MDLTSSHLMLQNLPPELITAIFEDLPQSDVASSATVSQVIGYVAERTLYSNIVVDHQTVEALAESFRTARPERAAFVTCLQVTDKLKGLDIGDATVGYVVQKSSSSLSYVHPERRESFGKTLCFILDSTPNILHLSLLFTIPNKALPLFHSWGEILSQSLKN